MQSNATRKCDTTHFLCLSLLEVIKDAILLILGSHSNDEICLDCHASFDSVMIKVRDRGVDIVLHQPQEKRIVEGGHGNVMLNGTVWYVRTILC
jgi:hypothetical protein